jgi:hypothetical protein
MHAAQEETFYVISSELAIEVEGVIVSVSVFGAVARLCVITGAARRRWIEVDYQAGVNRCRDVLGEVALQEAWDAGAALPLEAAIAEADAAVAEAFARADLRSGSDNPRSDGSSLAEPGNASGLTARERVVTDGAERSQKSLRVVG